MILMGEIITENFLMTIFNYEKLEKHLEEMSAKGWHLIKTGGLMGGYTYIKGTPSSVRYYVDFGYTNLSELFSRIFVMEAHKIKYEVYVCRRPEDRKSLLSQITLLRYIQIVYSIIGLTQLLISLAQFDSMIIRLHMSHSFYYNPIHLILFLLAGTFSLAMLVIIILLGVQCRQKKKKLASSQP